MYPPGPISAAAINRTMPHTGEPLMRTTMPITATIAAITHNAVPLKFVSILSTTSNLLDHRHVRPPVLARCPLTRRGLSDFGDVDQSIVIRTIEDRLRPDVRGDLERQRELERLAVAEFRFVDDVFIGVGLLG